MRAGDLFENWTDSTTLIYDGYPISDCRFVTVHMESYLVRKKGLEAGVHIKVWKNRQLYQKVYVYISHILDAASGKRFRVKLVYPENAWVSCEDDGSFVRISTFRCDENEAEYDKWSVILDHDELAFLQARFRPLTE